MSNRQIIDAELKDILGDGSQRDSEIAEAAEHLQHVRDADIRNMLTDSGQLKPPSEWPEGEARAILRTRFNNAGTITSVDFHDKNRASEQLNKLRGLYRNEEEISNPLDRMFERIPRDELVKLLGALRHLGDVPADDEDDEDTAGL